MKTDGLNNFIIVLLFGALILLAFLKFSNPYKVNKKANFWFGLFSLVWATFWMEEIVFLTSGKPLGVYFANVIHYLQIYLSLFFYMSVVFYINPNYKFRFSDLKHLIIPMVFLAIMLFQIVSNIDLQDILFVLIIIQPVLYTFAAFLKIRKHQKNVKLFSSNAKEIELTWLEYIIVICFLSSVLFGVYSFLHNSSPPNMYLNFFILVVVFFIAYYSLKQKEIYPFDEKQRTELIAFNEDSSTDLKRKIIGDEGVLELKQQLTSLMTEQRPYLESELNLVKLASLLSISPHQLSYLINTGFNENFFQFINKYRVEKAKELLLSSKKENLTILGIAFESGFNSKTSFNTTFKKITGQTPSEFKRSSTGL